MEPADGTRGPGSPPQNGTGRPEARSDAKPRPRLSDFSDKELIAASLSAAPGDSRAFDELVRRHQAHVRTNCRFLVKDPEDALDLAQEAFVKAYFGLASFGGKSSFRTWLRRIKVNQCLSFLESPRSRRDLRIGDFRSEADAGLSVESVAQRNVEEAESGERILRILDEIPDSLRVPLVLRDMDGFSYKEIQVMLNIGPSALKMRIARGREAFREAWANEEEGKE